MMYPVSLEERTMQSETIVLGNLLEKICYFDAEHKGIYTLNIIQVSAYLKGTVDDSTIGVISEGGVVDDRAQITFPSLDLEFENEYLFFLKAEEQEHDNKHYRTQFPEFFQAETYAASQGALTKQFGYFHDLYGEAPMTEAYLFSQIESYTGRKAADRYGNLFTARTGHTDPDYSAGREMPITGFSPSPTNAGTIVTSEFITIAGSGFGAGAGTVFYTNANDGGATFTSSGIATDNTAWSATSITNKVAQAAGTGPINVNGAMTSGSSLTVNYAHLCINSTFSGFASSTRQRYYLRNLNGSGGMSFQYNTTSGFSTNTPAIDAFERALETWRCAIYVNMDVSGTTTAGYLLDGISSVMFDGTLPAGVLARATSRFTGSATGGCTLANTVWFLAEVDIQAMPDPPVAGYTWQYGPTLPSATEYDFESVMLHELGHGIGLGHTIAALEVMHYAIANGSSKRTLATNEIDGGNAKMAYSTTATCFDPGTGGTEMIALSAGACLLLPLELVNFTGEYLENLDLVNLVWQTAAELNSDKFILEKSLDGEHFFTLEEIKAAGNSTEPNHYGYFDHDPVYGVNYYRLVMKDLDGSTVISDILPVPVADGMYQVNIYPNPVHDRLEIYFNGYTSAATAIQVFDVLGKELYAMIVHPAEPVNSVSINTADLPKGLYLVTVNSLDLNYTGRFIRE